MLEKLEVLYKGLQRGNKEGLFTLEESSLLLTNYVQLREYIQSQEQNKSMQKEPSVVVDDIVLPKSKK